MSSGIDIQFVRETYEKMSDQELIRVSTQDAVGLTNEAQEVVKEEIRKRNLNPNIIRGVDAQQKSYTVDEVDTYCEIIRSLPCPVTGSTSEKLNATLAAEVTSFIFYSRYKRKIIVGNPDILDKANDAALRTTAFLGWWGIPWGMIWTVKAIRINLKNKKANRSDKPSDVLRSFVLSKIGQIETYKDDKQKLSEIIARG